MFGFLSFVHLKGIVNWTGSLESETRFLMSVLIFYLLSVISLLYFCFPGRFITKGVSPVGWQVSFLWEACLHDGEGLRWGALLPQRVLSLFHVQFFSATRSPCIQLWRRSVSWNSRTSHLPVWFDFVDFLNPDTSFRLAGKLYCKLHFDQRNNGTNLRRTLSLRSVSSPHHVCLPHSNNDNWHF